MYYIIEYAIFDFGLITFFRWDIVGVEIQF